MACSGCDARRAWIKRKAKLAAQAVAALARQQPKQAEPVHPKVASGEFVEYLEPTPINPRLPHDK